MHSSSGNSFSCHGNNRIKNVKPRTDCIYWSRQCRGTSCRINKNSRIASRNYNISLPVEYFIWNSWINRFGWVWLNSLSICKVVSFTGEKKAIEKYNESLKTAHTAMVQQGLATGLGQGFCFLIMFSGYGLAVCYGSKLMIQEGYNGGRVITIIVAIMTGGL